MYIVVQHDITDPEPFWKAVKEGMEKGVPSHLRLQQLFPSQDRTKATCLWIAGQVEQVRDFLEPKVEAFSNNTYYAVQTEEAIGISDAFNA